jgi:hypothetical protein
VNLEQKEKERLIKGAVAFVTVAVIFFVELIFGVFSYALSWLTHWVFGFFSINVDVMYNTIFNCICFNASVAWSFYKFKKTGLK